MDDLARPTAVSVARVRDCLGLGIRVVWFGLWLLCLGLLLDVGCGPHCSRF